VRILYRVRQFWRTVTLKSNPHKLAQVQAQLSPMQWKLFEQLQPGEKDHAVTMFHKLQQQGENEPDLLAAALLHDIGKVRYRLSPMERAMIVLVKAIMPEKALRLGCLPPGGWEGLPGWRKAFIVSGQHASWGAELARQAGVSHQTESLIRLHHEPHALHSGGADASLLHKLWSVDNES
jgi:putative nucleotidyltransferase with HDIG domain